MSKKNKPETALQPTNATVPANAVNSLARQLLDLCKEALPGVGDGDKVVVKATKTSIEATITTEQGTLRLEETPAYTEMSVSSEQASREDKIVSAQALRDKGLTQVETAKRVGRSQPWVAMNTTKPKRRGR